MWRNRLVLAVLVAAALAGGYFGWFRDSSLVAVDEVRVEGVTGSDREAIVRALTRAGRDMTTLHVDTDRLVAVVRGFPTVESVSADTSLPHGMTIYVNEREPALLASTADQQVAVAADGTLLPGTALDGVDLPSIDVEELPPTGRLNGDDLEKALVIGAAPAPLRELIEGSAVSREFGVVVRLRGGVEVRFGDGSGPRAKWDAASAVLADPGLTAATYVDVSVPERPAVGGSAEPTPAAAPGEPDPMTTPTTTAAP